MTAKRTALAIGLITVTALLFLSLSRDDGTIYDPIDLLGEMAPGPVYRPISGLELQISGKNSEGELLGVFLQDSRQEKAITTYTAKRGIILTHDTRQFLVMNDGFIVHHPYAQRHSQVVAFDRYQIDLSGVISPDAYVQRVTPPKR